MEWYYKVLIGAGAAIARIVYGYLIAPKNEAFSWGKALRTCAAAAMTGAIVAYYGEGTIEQIALKLFAGTIALDEVLKQAKAGAIAVINKIT